MKKKLIAILANIISDMKKVAGNVSTIEYLFRLGCRKDELLKIGFNEADVNQSRYFADQYELIDVCGQVALFSNERIFQRDIPQDLFVYHLRGHDYQLCGKEEGVFKFVTIEPRVSVDHAGSVICKNPIDFGEFGYITFSDEDDEPNFFGNQLTISDYIDMDFE